MQDFTPSLTDSQKFGRDEVRYITSFAAFNIALARSMESPVRSRLSARDQVSRSPVPHVPTAPHGALLSSLAAVRRADDYDGCL